MVNIIRSLLGLDNQDLEAAVEQVKKSSPKKKKKNKKKAKPIENSESFRYDAEMASKRIPKEDNE